MEISERSFAWARGFVTDALATILAAYTSLDSMSWTS
jgi:hypothetical protein